MLGTAAVFSGNIASGQVSAAHISSGTIIAGAGIGVTANATNITITNLSGGFTLTSGIITSGMLGDFVVNTNNINSGAVTIAKLVSGLQISGLVLSGGLGSGQVNTVHLASGTTVTGLKDSTDFVAFGTISGGRCVAFNGSGQFVLANAISGGVPAFGILESVTNSGSIGSIRYAGPMQHVDFNFSGYIGQNVYVGLSGYPVGNAPVASGQFQQVIGLAINGSGILIMPQLTYIQIAQ